MGRCFLELTCAATLIMVATTAADATIYWCDASKKNAVVGASDISAVSITADRSGQECRYSINGETVGSPPRQLVVDAHNKLRRAEITKEIQSANMDPLAYALLAASPLREIPTELRGTLRNFAKQIEACFNALTANESGTFVSEPALACKVVTKSEGVTIGFGNGVIRAQPTTPDLTLLALGAVVDKTLEHYLFVSRVYVSGQLPPLQQR